MKAAKINVSRDAIKHIKNVMERTPGAIGFRLSMRKYGCNGYGYVPEVITEINKNDMLVPLAADFSFYLDKRYLKYLNETEIDFVTKSLGQEQLVFRNPNAEGECGCGESVNFKDEQDE